MNRRDFRQLGAQTTGALAGLGGQAGLATLAALTLLPEALAWSMQMPWASACSDAAIVELENGGICQSSETANARLRAGYSF